MQVTEGDKWVSERHRQRTGYVIEILGIFSRGRNPRLNMSTWDCPHYIANWAKKKSIYTLLLQNSTISFFIKNYINIWQDIQQNLTLGCDTLGIFHFLPHTFLYGVHSPHPQELV